MDKSSKLVFETNLNIDDQIIYKNLKLLLLDVGDLSSLKQSIQSKNNILDIKRCIL
jgi:hypothetical protein